LGKSCALQISPHLAQFLSRFPRPLFELEKSIGEGVKQRANELVEDGSLRSTSVMF
jgi:hypothetical protein